MTEQYTKEEITDAYSKLIYAQGLVDFVLRAGFNLREETKAETEGSLIAIFSIIQEYLKKVADVMDFLNMGSEWKFASLWKKEEKEENEE